ncbi:MAG: serine/threonine protein kinase [Alphaproteobacteria bacterium]|nr:serine/threonine protein kinase [Alphaproteobacteria bacterium]
MSGERTSLSPLETQALLSEVSGDAESLPAAADPSANRFGRYELLGVLGRGGMGVVLRARDTVLEREVALKMLRVGETGKGSNRRRRFLREARAVARLTHPNIIDIFDVGEARGIDYFTMQFVRGASLQERLREGPLTPEAAARVAAALARALHVAHTEGLIHRDVKPGNVLLDGDTPILTDFGLVKDLSGESAHLTRDAAVMGTPAYMSPEQALGETDAVGPRSDQFALGVMLYEMLSGEHPFKAPNPALTMQRVVSDDPPPLAGLPPALERICLQALAKEPEDRYPTTLAMAEDLERFLAGEAVLATGPSATRRLLQRARRHRTPLIAVAIAAVGLLLGIGGSAAQEHLALARREAQADERWAAVDARVNALLKAGRADEADAAFRAFADFPGNAETHALALAWRAQGERLRERDPDAAVDAFATSYALATLREDQSAALRAMAVSFRSQHAWDRLDAVTARLATLDPQAAARPELRRWTRDLAITRRDFDAARALDPPPAVDALLAALGQATATELHADDAFPWDHDGDGVRELAVWDTRGRHLTVVSPDAAALTPLAAHTLPSSEARLFPLQEAPTPALMNAGSDACRVFERRDGAMSLVYERTCEHVFDAESADLDRDGRFEHYVANERVLEVLQVDADGAWHMAPHKGSTGARASEVTGLESAEVDGIRSLFAGTSHWSSYDVRLLQPAGDTLSLIARHRLSTVRRLTLLAGARLRAAALTLHDPDQPLNHRFFRPGTPQGVPRGVHLLFVDDRGLTLERTLPTPTPPRRERIDITGHPFLEPDPMFAADLDGDGQDELLRGVEGAWTWIYTGFDGEGVEELALEGLMPIAAMNLDDDPADELLVRTVGGAHRLWVLGAGTDALPVLPSAPTAPRLVPDAVPQGLREPWSRAEELVAVGLAETAAERFDALASVSVEASTRALARLRAAEVLEESAAFHQAAARYLQAAEDPDSAAVALDGALRCLLADLRLEELLPVAARRAALPEPVPDALRDALARLTPGFADSEQVADFAEGLPTSWRVDQPSGVRLDRVNGALKLRGAGVERLLHQQVAWTGDPVMIELEMTPGPMLWAGRWSFGPEEPQPLDLWRSLKWLASGGGDVSSRWLSCPDLPTLREEPAEPPLVDTRVVLRWTWDPAVGRASCSLSGPAGIFAHTVYDTHQQLLSEEPFALSLASISEAETPFELTLHRIRTRGLAPVEQPPDPLAEARRALALGRPGEALALLQANPQESWPWRQARIVALAGSGQPAEATRVLREALRRDPELHGDLVPMLRRHTELVGAVYVELFGAAAWTRLGHVFFTEFYHLPELGRGDALLLRWLDGLREAPLDTTADPETQGLHPMLLAARAGAWRRAEQPGEAALDVARGRAIAEEILARRGAQAHHYVRFALHRLRMEQASLALMAGEPEAAIDALLEAIADSETPEVLADQLAAMPRFDPLHDHPAWARIEAARRLTP